MYAIAVSVHGLPIPKQATAKATAVTHTRCTVFSHSVSRRPQLALSLPSAKACMPLFGTKWERLHPMSVKVLHYVEVIVGLCTLGLWHNAMRSDA